MERVIGTMLYMAPEVVQKNPYDEMSDIWAVGIVLFVMLTGRVPYKQKDMKRLLRLIKVGEYDKQALHDPCL
jgi:serine/threonine protein kinase